MQILLDLWHQFLIFPAGAFFTGIFGGLLGVGGGLFLVPFLTLIVGLPAQQAIGTSLVCVIGTSAGAMTRINEKSEGNLPVALQIEPAMILGSAVASFYAHRVANQTLLLGFSVFLVTVSALLWLQGYLQKRKSTDIPHETAEITASAQQQNVPQKMGFLVAIAFLSGITAGFLGVGGGVLMIPAMLFFSKMPIKAALGTSTFALMASGASGAVVHWAHGGVAAGVAALCLLGAIPGGRLGAAWQARLPTDRLRAIFIGVLLLMAGVIYYKTQRS